MNFLDHIGAFNRKVEDFEEGINKDDLELLRASVVSLPSSESGLSLFFLACLLACL